MDLAELEAALAARGHPAFHARQIYSLDLRKGVTDFEQMTDLSRPLRADLAAALSHLDARASSSERHSTDGTAKFLLELDDGRRIESVFIPDTPGANVLRFHAGRLRDEVRLLPDRQNGTRPQSDGRRNRRTGSRARGASSGSATRSSTSC